MVDKRFYAPRRLADTPVFVAPQCASCGREENVELYAEPDVGFCEECVEHGRLKPEYELFDDIGVGD